MKRDYPERPMIGVGAVIIHRDRVLLVRRATEPLKGEWLFLAACWNWGRNFVTACIAKC
jgi:8-oxo-dGTP diphosphatase